MRWDPRQNAFVYQHGENPEAVLIWDQSQKDVRYPMIGEGADELTMAVRLLQWTDAIHVSRASGSGPGLLPPGEVPGVWDE